MGGQEETVTKKIRRCQLYKTAASFLLVPVCIAYLFHFFTAGLLAGGYFTPYDIRGSLARCDAVTGKGIWDRTKVSLAVSSDDLADTGIYMEMDNNPAGYYLAARVEGKYIICYVSAYEYKKYKSGDSLTFTGGFEPLEPEVESMVLDIMAKSGIGPSNARNMLYGYYINPSVSFLFLNRTIDYLPFLALLVLTAVLLIRSILPLLDIYRYHGFKNLPDMSRETALESIERQFADLTSERVYDTGKCRVYLMRNWLIVKTFWNFRFYLADDLLWAYKSSFVHLKGGYMRHSRRRFVYARAKYATAKVPGRDARLDGFLTALSEAYPWITIGYSRDKWSTWESENAKFTTYAKRRKAETGFRDLSQKADML
jgi:hypothetical protein